MKKGLYIFLIIASLICIIVGGSVTYYLLEARDSCMHFQSTYYFEECLEQTDGFITFSWILVTLGGFIFIFIAVGGIEKPGPENTFQNTTKKEMIQMSNNIQKTNTKELEEFRNRGKLIPPLSTNPSNIKFGDVVVTGTQAKDTVLKSWRSPSSGPLLSCPQIAHLLKHVGRVIQIRVGQGIYRSDLYLIRHPNGDFVQHENQQFWKLCAEDAKQILSVFPQTTRNWDSEASKYTLYGERGETGFLITGEKNMNPKPYNMGEPDDLICWFKRMEGYLKASNFAETGTDFEGRKHALNGFKDLKEILLKSNENLAIQNTCRTILKQTATKIFGDTGPFETELDEVKAENKFLMNKISTIDEYYATLSEGHIKSELHDILLYGFIRSEKK